MKPWEKYQPASSEQPPAGRAAPWERYGQGQSQEQPSAVPASTPESETTQPTYLINGVGEPMEPGLGRDIVRLIAGAAEGANEGLLRTLELPYDAINNLPRLANLLPGEQGVGKISEMAEGVPILGELFATDDPGVELGRQMGVTGQMQAETPAERVSQRVGEEVGMTMLPLAGLNARAARLPSAIGDMNRANLFDRAFALPFRDAPVRANAAEVATAVGAGGGAGVARETLGDTPEMDMLGALLGGMGTGAALNTGSNIGRAVSDVVTDAPARVATGEQLVRSAADPNAAFSQNTVNRARNLSEEVAGVRPSTGQASGDTGVLAMEYSRSTGGPAIGKYQQRQVENNAALRNAFEDTAPDVADDVATRAALENRRQSVTDQAGRVASQRRQAADAAGGRQADLETQRGTAQQQFEDDYADIASQRNLRETGSEGVSEAYRGARENVSAERRATYDRAQELGRDTKVDATPFTEQVDQIVDDIGPLADTGADPTLMRVVRDLEGMEPGSSVSVSDLIDMQPRLSRALRTSQSAMRGDTNRALSQIDRNIKSTLNDMADEGDEAALAWREANQMAAEEAPLFRQGTGGQVDKQTRRGAEPADSAVGSRFIRPDTSPGAPESAQQLRQIIDKSPDPTAAQASVRDFVVGSLADRMSGRRPTVAAVDDFIRQHSQSLREFPEVRKELSQMRNRLDAKSTTVGRLEDDITAAKREVADAQGGVTRAEKRQQGLERSLQSDDTVVGRYLNRETGRESMGRILSAKKPQEAARTLMQQVKGDPDAVEGARRAFFDMMDEAVSSTRKDVNDNPLFKKDAFIKFMNRNGTVAKEVLGEKHTTNLRKIAKELDALEQTSNARPAGSSGTAAGQQGTGLTLNSVLSRLYGIQRGVVSPRFVASEILARQVNALARRMKTGDINRLLDDALLDPQLARTLATEYSKENDRLLTKRLPAVLSRLGARGARAAAAGDEEGERLEDGDEE